MNNFMNDPLGAMGKAASYTNSAIQSNVKKAAEGIKNNENLKASLISAKEKTASGLAQAAVMAGSAAGKMQDGARDLHSKNYHG